MLVWSRASPAASATDVLISNSTADRRFRQPAPSTKGLYKPECPTTPRLYPLQSDVLRMAMECRCPQICGFPDHQPRSAKTKAAEENTLLCSSRRSKNEIADFLGYFQQRNPRTKSIPRIDQFWARHFKFWKTEIHNRLIPALHQTARRFSIVVASQDWLQICARSQPTSAHWADRPQGEYSLT